MASLWAPVASVRFDADSNQLLERFKRGQSSRSVQDRTKLDRRKDQRRRRGQRSGPRIFGVACLLVAAGIGCSGSNSECLPTSPLTQGVLVLASSFFGTHPSAHTLTVCVDQRCVTAKSDEATVQALNLDHALQIQIIVRTGHNRVLLHRTARATYRLRRTTDTCGYSGSVRSVTIGLNQDGTVEVMSQ